MDRHILAAFVLAFLVVMLGLLVLGWRARRRRQSAFAAPQHPPIALGETLGAFAGYYVATTVADDRFNRVAVGGLGFRAKTEVGVHSAGLVIPIAGQRDIFVPAGDIASAGRATWTIDRVVEEDGLIVVAWRLAETAVESYFRVEDSEALLHALARIAPETPTDSPVPAEPAPTESDSK